MGRIIPWDLPEVNGGSVGGYTPEPTPEPPAPEITTPYDLTDFAASISLGTLSYELFGRARGSYSNISVPKGDYSADVAAAFQPSVTVSGVKLNDVTNVGQIIAHCKIDKSDLTPSAVPNEDETGSFVTYDLEFTLDITHAMTTIGGTVTPQASETRKMVTVSSPPSTRQSYIRLYIAAASADVAVITSVDVLNANGVPLQTWTPEEEEE